jgi:hypothetical protein
MCICLFECRHTEVAAPGQHFLADNVPESSRNYAWRRKQHYAQVRPFYCCYYISMYVCITARAIVHSPEERAAILWCD